MQRNETTAAGSTSLRVPVIGLVLDSFRGLRRWGNRVDWVRRMLGRPQPAAQNGEGLILIQIDGLSRPQFDRALKSGKMPFLRRLMAREGYELYTHYSGIPSTTSAVQAELFYGARTAVPAHAIGDRKTGRIVTMLDSERAAQVERQLQAAHTGLLMEGSAYSNIYTGGASHPHFCAAAMGWGDLLRGIQPLRIAGLALLHADVIVRTAGEALVELGLAIADCIRGISDWKEFRKAVNVLPSRVAVGVVLRELITVAAGVDAAEGLPVVQLNFLGYDEHAHLRGPDSRFAHWTLRRIDRCIRRVWDAAMHSEQRQYNLWVYSDHGQERVTPFEVATGKLITDVVREIFRPLFSDALSIGANPSKSVTHGRARLLRRAVSGTGLETAIDETLKKEEILVAAIGPLGHIYLPTSLARDRLLEACRVLATEGQVPLVLLAGDPGQALAWTADGAFVLPNDAVKIFGDSHPFRTVAAEDLVQVCHHPSAGDVVIGGWRAGVEPMTFVFEKGAHGGIGPEETAAFALVPSGTSVESAETDFVRPCELRQAGLHVLGRNESVPSPRIRRARDFVRLMTYNVHSCMGLDGRLSIRRIARVLLQCDADVIALQELDVQRSRSGLRDQAMELAEVLEMSVHFHPAFSVATERYGDAVLSRLPMRLRRAANLAPDPSGRQSEPRGAIWVTIDSGEWQLQVINTHLGLRRQERLKQVEELLGPNWLGHPDCIGSCVLCGDFNAGPRSSVYRRITARLQDAQGFVNDARTRCTWCSPYPLFRIDHVFVSPDVQVVAADVPRSAFVRTASDHLPVLIDLQAERQPGGQALRTRLDTLFDRPAECSAPAPGIQERVRRGQK